MTGLLAPPGEPAALAAALERLLRDRGLRDRLGAAGERRVRGEFSSVAGAERLAEKFRDLLATEVPVGEGRAPLPRHGRRPGRGDPSGRRRRRGRRRRSGDLDGSAGGGSCGVRIAFYAPLKAPDHPVPSGDRAIARLLLAALERAGAVRGWDVEVASRFRSFDAGGDADRQARLRDAGTLLAERLVGRYRSAPASARPGLWFTYHVYHKAPDWLGPAVTACLGIPYVVAEASHAAKQAGGGWSIGHEAAERAIRHADAVLALNPDDVPGVGAVVCDPSRIVPFAPFLGPRGRLADEDGFRPGPPEHEALADPIGFGRGAPAVVPDPSAAARRSASRAAAVRRYGVPAGEPWLLCVAMMRGGRKLASFEVLARALARPGLAAEPWHLLVAGDGPARSGVEAAFARRVPARRVTFTGRVGGETLARLYAGSDLFVWPAVGEPMGMAMLEAQSFGLPVVAARTRGVPELVADGETGLLAPEGDAGAFAAAVGNLLGRPELRRRMSRAARARVARNHSFEMASERLGGLVSTLLQARPSAMQPVPEPNSESGAVRSSERAGEQAPGRGGASGTGREGRA